MLISFQWAWVSYLAHLLLRYTYFVLNMGCIYPRPLCTPVALYRIPLPPCPPCLPPWSPERKSDIERISVIPGPWVIWLVFYLSPQTYTVAPTLVCCLLINPDHNMDASRSKKFQFVNLLVDINRSLTSCSGGGQGGSARAQAQWEHNKRVRQPKRIWEVIEEFAHLEGVTQ